MPPEEAHVHPAVVTGRLVVAEDPGVAGLASGTRSTSHRRPRSSTSTRMPFSASRRAVIAPPKPLPITMTSKGVGMPAARIDRPSSATHALFVDANVGGRIVAVVAPAGVVELDDVVGVVGGNRLGESQLADALPVRRPSRSTTPVDRFLRPLLDTEMSNSMAPVGRRVARLEQVAVDLVAEIEAPAFDLGAGPAPS